MLSRDFAYPWRRAVKRYTTLAHRGVRRPEGADSTMKNPLDSLWGTIVCGVILTAILYFVAEAIVHAAGVGA